LGCYNSNGKGVHIMQKASRKIVFLLSLAAGIIVFHSPFLWADALHEAAAQGQLQLIENLVSQGADINAQDADGRTPLHIALRNGQWQAAKLLVFKGADINTANENGFTVLHGAAYLGKKEAVEHIVELGGNVNALCEEGLSPLHYAISNLVPI